MYKAKKVISLLLACMVVVGMLAACGGADSSGGDSTTANTVENSTSTNGNTESAKKDPDVIRYIQWQDSSMDASILRDNEMMLQEKLNIKLVKQVVPIDSREEKTNVLLAAGAVDIARLPKVSTYISYANAGALVDLTDLMKEKAPNYMKVMDPKLIELYSIKGRLFAIPTMGEHPKPGVDRNTPMANYLFSIRKDWLDKLGLQPPKTMDEVYNVAKAFYDADINKVGKKNLAIIGACNGFVWNNFDWVFGAYGVMFNTWTMDESTKEVKSYDIDPRMKEALSWLNKAYQDGLIDKDFITQKEPQIHDKIMNNKVGIYSSHWYPIFGGKWATELDEKILRDSGKLTKDQKYEPDLTQPTTTLIQIDPPTGPRGDKGYATDVPQMLEWMQVIPKNSKAIDAILRVVDFLATKEGSMLVVYGTEGKDYVLDAAKGPQPGSEVTDKTKFGEYQREKGIGGLINFTSIYPLSEDGDWATNYVAWQPWMGKFGVDTIFDSGFKNANIKYSDVVKIYGLSAPSSGQNMAKITALRDEYFAKMVVGKEGTALWDKYVEEWKAQGGEQLQKEFTQDYKDRYSK